MSIGATSTCGAALTAEAGSVAGIVVSGGSSGAGGGRYGDLGGIGGEVADVFDLRRAAQRLQIVGDELALALVEQELLDRRRRLLQASPAAAAKPRG